MFTTRFNKIVVGVLLMIIGVANPFYLFSQNNDILLLSNAEQEQLKYIDSLSYLDYTLALEKASKEIKGLEYWESPVYYAELLRVMQMASFLSAQIDLFDSINAKILSLPVKKLHPARQGKILMVKSSAANLGMKNIDAIIFSKESLVNYEEDHNIEGQISSLEYIAKIYFSMGRYQSSVEYFNRAISKSQEIENKEYYVNLLLKSLESLSKLDSVQEAQNRINTVNEIVEENPEIVDESSLNFELAKFYYYQNNDYKALQYIDKNIILYKKLNNKIRLALMLTWKAEVYHRMKDYSTALRYGHEALSIRHAANLKMLEASSNYNIAGNMIRLHKYDSALYYIERGDELYKPYRKYSEHLRGLDLRRQVFLELKDYENAFQVLEQSMLMKDSIKQMNDKQKVFDMETDFAMEKYDQQNRKIQAEAQVEKMEKEHNTLLLKIELIVLLLLLLSFYISYMNIRNRSRRKFILGSQQLIFIQMNSHFVFNALTAIQSLIYKKEFETAVFYLDMFTSLINRVLDGASKSYMSLKDEIDFVKEFLEIQRLRFGDDFNYQINVAENLDLSDYKIPPMLAYPFIEYAVEERVQKTDGDAWIIININKAGNFIEYELVDKNIGFLELDDCYIKRYGGQEILCRQLTQERMQAYNKLFHQRIIFSKKMVIFEGEECPSLQFKVKI